VSGSRFLQPELSRFINQKVATPLHQVSRFAGNMAESTMTLALDRIARSIAALARLLSKPPPPPPNTPFKSMFLKKAQPRRKLRKEFRPF
jgi:hypothetical protein